MHLTFIIFIFVGYKDRFTLIDQRFVLHSVHGYYLGVFENRQETWIYHLDVNRAAFCQYLDTEK